MMPISDTKTDRLIAQLTADLRPVRPLRGKDGLLLVALAGAATLAVVALVLGWRADVRAGEPTGMFIIANGLLLMLGLAAASAVVAMASPQVGNRHDGWRWALAAACLLPLAAVVTAGFAWDTHPLVFGATDLSCVLLGALSAVITAAALTFWLRRGAPANPDRAGLLTGLASGAIGTFAYGFHCPVDSIVHLGLAHALPVAVCALVGWLVVGRLVRW